MTRHAAAARVRGIVLGDLAEKLDPEAFPLERAALLEVVGGHELEFHDAETATLESVLEPAGVDWFHSYDDLVVTVSHMVDRRAVGQPGRTGRGTSHLVPPDRQRPPGRPDDDGSRSF